MNTAKYKIGDRVILNGSVGVITDGPKEVWSYVLYEVRVVVDGATVYPRVYGHEIRPA